MTTDSRTTNRNYPESNALNTLSADMARAITAIRAIDTDIASLLTSVAGRALLSHTHTIGSIDGLTAALNAKRDASWVPALGDLGNVNVSGAANGQFLRLISGVWSPSTISVAWGDISGRPSSFPTAWSDVQLKPSTFPPSTHAHPTSEVTGLDTALSNLQTSLNDGLSLKLNATHAGAGGTVHAEATGSVAGFMSAADKVKLGLLRAPEVQSLAFANGSTAVDFTIPDWATRFSIAIGNLALSGSDFVLFQGLDASDQVKGTYNGSSSSGNASVATTYAGSNAGIPIRTSSTNNLFGMIRGERVFSPFFQNYWALTVLMGGATQTTWGGGNMANGSVPFSKLRITRNGTNTFTSGIATATFY
jgi:hypothetical protein